MKRGKKCLSLLLALVLCLSMLPGSAFALELPNLDVIQNAVEVVEAEVEGAIEEPEETEMAQGTAAVLKSSGDVAINETNFPDDIFRAYVQEEFDTNGDWMLSEEERNIAGIDCSDMGIGSLEGIEYFTKLRSLNCSGNNLTELDVSNSPKLEYLYCEDNMLSSLDVSNHSELVYVHCYNNCLESLDVSGKPVLERVWCSGNNLVSLDISDNPNLKSLICESNNLVSLDVSNNLNLGSLMCGDNKLSSLDVSNNPKLKNLLCWFNNLESLDVSNNPELLYLHCFNNRLKKLDISNSPNLEELMCYSNQLQELDISCNTLLQALACEENDLTVLDISNNPYLVDWVVNGESLEYDGMVAYGEREERYEGLVAYLCFDSSISLIDGIPDAVELISLMKSVVAESGIMNASSYDYNGDGGVDILDVIRAIRYLAGENVELN